MIPDLREKKNDTSWHRRSRRNWVTAHLNSRIFDISRWRLTAKSNCLFKKLPYECQHSFSPCSIAASVWAAVGRDGVGRRCESGVATAIYSAAGRGRLRVGALVQTDQPIHRAAKLMELKHFLWMSISFVQKLRRWLPHTTPDISCSYCNSRGNAAARPPTT